MTDGAVICAPAFMIPRPACTVPPEIRLFKTEVGAIHDRNLSEGFANYVEMRYDDSARGRLRYKLAQRMFPATTRRFGEILEEIGNGEHRYVPKGGRDHASENTLSATRKPKK